jgi:hypothetical protein
MRYCIPCGLVVQLVTLTMLGFGCAWTTVTPVAKDDRTTPGFRYYDAKPLLLVTKTNTQIVFVPNYSRPYAVSFGAFLAKHEMKLTITDAVFFKEIDDKQDPSELVKGLIALGQDALKAAASAASAASDAVAGELVAVYEFKFDDNGNITAMKQVVPPVPPGA